MTPALILLLTACYFGLIMVVAWFTGRRAGHDDFFIGGHKSPWFLVAFGMIGTSLSGVTFISVPGVVGNLDSPNQQFGYMQMVLGYLVGYAFIGTVLMPLYYRLRLTSIYTYLDQRFGVATYKTGATFFLLSRTMGASFRIFLVTAVFQEFVLGPMGVHYAVTISATLILIWVYTAQGGIRTIVYTDAIQTFFMLLAVVLTLFFVMGQLKLGLGGLRTEIAVAGLGKSFFFDSGSPAYFWRQFLTGAAIATVMTGLDQDMMQKNNSCPNIRDAQKNMFTFSIILVLVNLIFVGLGAALHVYAAETGFSLPDKTDHIYPALALNAFPVAYGAIFIIGLIAAAFSSADSALTALTTSFCVDILGFPEGKAGSRNDGMERELQGGSGETYPAETQGAARRKKIRLGVHLAFSLLVLVICYTIYAKSRGDVLGNLFRAAGFTYGPLLGLYFFGLFSKRRIRDGLAPLICVLSVLICLFFGGQDIVGALAGWSPGFIGAWKALSSKMLGGYVPGFELLIYNGLLTGLGLLIISKPAGGSQAA